MSTLNPYEKLQQRKQLIEKTNQLIESAMQDLHTDPLDAYERAGMAYQLSVSGPFSEEPYLIGMGDSLHAMSIINMGWKKLSLALTQAHNSQKLAELLHNDLLIIKNIRIIAEVYFLLNNFEKAQELFIQILQKQKTVIAKGLDIEAYQFLAQMALQQQEFNTAKTYILKGIDLCGQDRQDEQSGYCYLLYGRICLGLEDFTKAAYSVSKAMELSNRDRYPVLYAQCLDLLSTLGIAMGKFAEAELNFSMMAAYAMRHRLEEEYLQALLGICLVKKQIGSEMEYLQTLQEMLTLPYLINHHDLQSKVDLLLSQVYERKKQNKLALQHFKRFHTIQHNWLKRNLSENLQALEAIHQTESAMAEVELVDGINKELNTEIQERSWAEKQLRKSEEKFRNLAVIDSLTGLYNRRHFYKMGMKEVERAFADKFPLSLIMMDIDYYKEINDRYGHRAGDCVLSQLGELINQGIRKIDLACRYGGEEFAILLPETTLDQAELLAERLREAVADANMKYEDQQINLTASFGIVGLCGGTRSIEDMLSQADDAMYQAKLRGRNQVICCRANS
jgi:diguanylate cyclase (GGDEF)-like protein